MLTRDTLGGLDVINVSSTQTSSTDPFLFVPPFQIQNLADEESRIAKELANGLKCVILDASGWMFTDTVGLRGIKEVRLLLKNLECIIITDIL